MAFSDDDLKLVMTVDPDTSAITKELDQLGGTVDKIADDGMEKITKSLKAQRDQIASANQLLGPRADLLKQEVANRWEMVEAQKALDDAKATEELNLRRPVATAPQSQAASSDISNPQQLLAQLKALDQQKEALKSIQSMLDPTLLTERVRLTEMERDLKAQLAVETIRQTMSDEAAVRKRINQEKELMQELGKLKELEDSIRKETEQQTEELTLQQDELQKVNAALEQQQEIVERLAVALDPSLIQRRIDLSEQEAEARAKIAAVEESLRSKVPTSSRAPDARRNAARELTSEINKQRDAQAALQAMDDPALTALRMRTRAEGDITAELQHQSEVAALRSKMDPDSIADTVRKQREMTEAQETYNAALKRADADPIRDAAKELTKEILQQREIRASLNALEDPALANLRARSDSEKSITAELQHQADLAAIRAQMEPKALADAVRRQRELTKAQEELSKAKSAEQHEQGRPGTFQRLFSDPGKALSDMAANASKFFSEMGSEFGKGGVGGVIDKTLGGGGEKEGGAGATNMLLGGILGGQGGGDVLGQVGGMLGTAIAGPAGAVVGEMVGKAVQGGIELPAKIVADGFALIGSSLNELSGTLGPIGMGLELASGAAEAFVGAVATVSPALASVIGPLAKLPAVLKGILETLTSFAGKASPASIMMFQYAIEDVQAVIGGSFLPVLRLMRDGVRLFGDTLATILPNFRQVGEAMTVFTNAFHEANMQIRASLAVIGPQIRTVLIDTIRQVSGVLAQLGPVIANMVSGGFNMLLRAMQTLSPIIVQVARAFVSVGPMIGGVVSSIVSTVAPLVQTALQYGSGLFNFVKGIVDIGIALGSLGIGNSVGVLMSIVDVLFKVSTTVVDVIGSITEAIGSVVSAIISPITALSSAFGELGSPIGILKAALDGVAATFRFVAGIIKFIADGINIVFEPVISGARQLGSAFREVFTLFSDIKQAIGELMSSIGSVFGDSIRGVISAFNPLKILGDVIRSIAGSVSAATRAIRAFLVSIGLLRPQAAPGVENSTGAAARPASMQGIEEYQRSLQLASYSEPGAVGSAEVPMLVSNISVFVQQIAEWTNNFTIPNLIAQLRGLVPSPTDPFGVNSTVANAVSNFFGGAPPTDWSSGASGGGTWGDGQ